MKIFSRGRPRFPFFPAQMARLGLACVVGFFSVPTGAWGQATGSTTTSTPGAPPPGSLSNPDTLTGSQMFRMAEDQANNLFAEKLQSLWNAQRARSAGDSARGAFIPPFLPVMLEPVSAGTAPDASPDYPAKQAACAGDTYFMAYTSLLRQNAWSDQRAQRVEAALAARRKLLEELRATLAQAAALPADKGLALLAGLARTQSPALQALEAEEESIRLDLTTRAAFRPYEDGIRLPVTASAGPKLPPVAIVLLFAVQFDPGLTADQRELLQGVVQELGESAGTAAPSFSFWPARARLPLPPNLPAELLLRLQRIQQLKQQLTAELADVLNRKRDESRAAALSALAARQAPTFAALATLADELRPQLAAFYAPPPAPAADAPPALLQQVERAFARKAALEHRVNADLGELRRLLPDDQFELVRRDQTQVIVHTPGKPSDKSRALTKADLRALRDWLKKTNDELAAHTLALTKESQALQSALRDYRDRILPAPRQDLGQIAAALVQTVTARENERLYRDYRAAALQPGLSLEQRRLLLRGVLAEIELTRARDPWAD